MSPNFKPGARRSFLMQGTTILIGSAMPLRLAYALPVNQSSAALVLELDLSTTTRDVGRAIQDGVQAALLAAKSSLPVALVNTQGNPVRALDGVDERSQDGRVLAVIGGGDGNVTPGLMRWADANQVPFGIAWASNAKGQHSGRWSFSLGPDDARCIASALNEGRARGKRRWGFLLSNDAVGRASYDTLLALMALPSAPELLGVQWHDVVAQDVGAQYLRLQQQGANAIWLSGYPRAARQLAKAMQLQSQQRTLVPVLASPNAWSAQFAADRSEPFAGMPLFFDLPEPSKKVPAQVQAKSAWPHPASANAYALTSTLLQEIKKSPTDLAKQRVAIARAWRSLQAEHGHARTGMYHYDAQGQLVRATAAQVFR